MSFLHRSLALVCILAAGPALVAPGGEVFAMAPETKDQSDKLNQRKQRKALASTPLRYRRGRRAQAKPNKRPNRMHISKRVRRKHRRAA